MAQADEIGVQTLSDVDQVVTSRANKDSGLTHSLIISRVLHPWRVAHISPLPRIGWAGGPHLTPPTHRVGGWPTSHSFNTSGAPGLASETWGTIPARSRRAAVQLDSTPTTPGTPVNHGAGGPHLTPPTHRVAGGPHLTPPTHRVGGWPTSHPFNTSGAWVSTPARSRRAAVQLDSTPTTPGTPVNHGAGGPLLTAPTHRVPQVSLLRPGSPHQHALDAQPSNSTQPPPPREHPSTTGRVAHISPLRHIGCPRSRF